MDNTGHTRFWHDFDMSKLQIETVLGVFADGRRLSVLEASVAVVASHLKQSPLFHPSVCILTSHWHNTADEQSTPSIVSY